MKRFNRGLGGFVALVASAVMFLAACSFDEHTLVFLSTNDMHARIQYFPQLASAVQQCRDTTDAVLLVDAGDRWTGNAYVDMTEEKGRPIIDMMNALKYDAATLGNHEFDHGQAHLGKMIGEMNTRVICANTISDTCTFPQLDPYTIIEKDGVKIGLIGVVTNYEGGDHPAGNEESFRGVRFPDPQAMAIKYAEELRPQCDLVVLVSHMGDDRDAELLEKTNLFDFVIGGHTHKEVDTVINGTLLTQTGKNLHNIGVTTVVMDGKKVKDIDFRLIPLSEYEPDPQYLEMQRKFYDNKELNSPVGEFTKDADKVGLANWMAESIRDAAGCELGFYHFGGVRLDGIPAGGVGTAKMFDLEPFGTKVVGVELTREQLHDLILAKYNDDENRKEAHRVDLFSPCSYVIVTDEQDHATDVLFPTLDFGRKYKVALPDYVFRNYKYGVDFGEGVQTGIQVNKLLLENLKKTGKYTPDNKPHQRVVVSR